MGTIRPRGDDIVQSENQDRSDRVTRGLQDCRLATCSSFPWGLHRKADLRADAGFHGMLAAGTANTGTAAIRAGPHSSRPVVRLALPPPAPALGLWEARAPSSSFQEKPCLAGAAEVASQVAVFCSREQRVRLGASQVPFCSKTYDSSNFSQETCLFFK